MSHLTAIGGSLAAAGAAGAAGPGFGISGYAHPLPGPVRAISAGPGQDLAPVERAELMRPGTPLHWAVLNVADGPGTMPDPHCLEAAGRLRNAGVRVLGHLDLAYGARSFGAIVSEAHDFHDWYRVDGFYLDRCPAQASYLPDVRRTAATLDTVAHRGHLVLGHGTHPHPGYAEIADQLVTFRGPWTDYRWSQVAEWTADHPPERFVHLVHGVPRSHLDEAMRIARWQGAGTVFFTDRSDHDDPTGQNSPFAALPGYWDEIVSQIGPGVSE